MNRFKFILLSLFLFVPFSVKADHIYNVDMNISIDKGGTASVTETWDVKADSGSEWYKAYNNLENVEISNYTVSMDGKALKYKGWEVQESLEQKRGYYGINRTSEGVELCFGKYDMKRHKFTMKYTLSNFVFNVEDAQAIYFTLLPDATVDSFNVNITSFESIPDSIDVWGYGYQGYAYVKDGKITMTNENGLNGEYVVLLAKFPQGTFDTSNSYSQFSTFDSLLETAEEGSYEYDYSNYGYTNNDNSFIGAIIEVVFAALFVIASVPIAIFSENRNKYGYKDNKVINKKEVPMFRDIPCNKDIYYANALIKLNGFGYSESNILGAIILKWVKQDKITFINEKKGVFNKETSSIDLTKNNTFDNPDEEKLFNLMRAASGDGILEAKELEKWARKHYSEYLNLFGGITNKKINDLKANSFIYNRTSKQECKYKNVMNDVLYKDSTELYGLKKFLDEFSRMEEKEVIEVKIWDEYLMFAYLFGIADKVATQLKRLYPEQVSDLENKGLDLNTIYYINHISSSSIRAASSARSAAQSYSGGGGGFSSGGGGGGSFGGGGSMGGR